MDKVHVTGLNHLTVQSFRFLDGERFNAFRALPYSLPDLLNHRKTFNCTAQKTARSLITVVKVEYVTVLPLVLCVILGK